MLDITPLSVAVRDASFSTIRMLFDHGGEIEHGELLHLATARTLPDALELLEYILDKGAPINEVIFQNHLESYEREKYSGLVTPLHSASRKGKLDMVELLLSRGADPLIKDSRGMLAIDLAEHNGFSEVVSLLSPRSILPKSPRHDWTEGRRVGEDLLSEWEFKKTKEHVHVV